MKTKKHPVTGIWYVAVRDTRAAGVWKREYEYAPGDWLIDFMSDGSFFETFRNDEKCTVRKWMADEATGIVSIVSDPPGAASMKCVFEDGDGPYLYYYDDLPHIPENIAAIVEHHAHTRLKLTGTGKKDR